MATSVDTNALTDLCGVKRHLSLTSGGDDMLLTNLINQVSDRIETIASRRFKARDYRLWLNGKRQRTLVLPEYPVVYINRVATGSQDTLSVAYSGAAIRATAQVYRDSTGQTGGVRLVSYDTSGTRSTSELTVANNGSTSAMATAITAVSGWTGTASVNVPSADLHPTGGQNTLTRTAIFTAPDDDDSDYRVDHETGLIELVKDNDFGFDVPDGRFSGGFQSVLVECRLGYATVPVGLELVANELVAESYRGRARDTNLTSESIGNYSYTLAAQAQVSESMMARLKPYMRIAVGGAA